MGVQKARKIYKESCLNIVKMLGLFGHKKRIDKLRGEVQDSFNHVKKDFNKVGEWIKHLDDKHGSHVGEIDEIKDQLLTLQKDIMELKDFVSFFGPQLSKGLSKQIQTSVVKQTGQRGVQTVVQTAVQTDILDSLTVMERAIVWALLNSEMKLSYEDLAALLGKDKSTIRGQINTIKQKNEGLIMEAREVSGKKRLYIPEEIKSCIMKSVKVKIKRKKSKSES
jgi:predicted transcriptional regulator